MKGSSELIRAYPELNSLLKGSSPTAPIIQNTYPLTPDAYEKQRRSVEKRGSCANVIGVLFIGQGVVIVERTGTNPGKALLSGAVEDGESFLDACVREAKEEANIELDSASLSLLSVEIRNFVNLESNTRQHVIAGAVLGHLAAETVPELTEAARHEGLKSVETCPVIPLPEFVFNDGDLVRAAWESRSAA